jgi:hypothetical protein
MPFKSEAQRRLFFAKMNSGEMSPSTVKHWEKATKNKDLPEKVSQFGGPGSTPLPEGAMDIGSQSSQAISNTMTAPPPQMFSPMSSPISKGASHNLNRPHFSSFIDEFLKIASGHN